MHKVLVSVWMIAYNHENYIREAIDSILMQETDFDYEIVIGEDCSTDNTRAILLEYKKQFPEKFKLLLHEKNLGLIDNMLTTFSACSGKYIATLEGDDYWSDPMKLQKQADFLEKNPEYSMCYHAIDNVKSDGTYINTFTQPIDCSSEELLTGQFIMQTSSNMHRRIALVYPSAFREVNLFDPFLIHLYGFYGSAKYIEEISPSKWRRHEEGVWSVQDKNDKAFLSINSKRLMRENLADFKLKNEINKNLNKYYLDVMFDRLRNKELYQYIKLVKMFINDQEINVWNLYPKHIADVFQKIYTKVKIRPNHE